MSSYPNPNSASSVPYNTYPDQQNVRPPQQNHNPNYGYQAQPQQGASVHSLTGGGESPFPTQPNYHYYAQNPVINNEYIPAQPTYPGSYGVYPHPDQPVNNYIHPYSHRTYYPSPQAQFLHSPQQQIPYHRSPSQLSTNSGQSASPVVSNLPPQAEAAYPQPSLSPLAGGIDSSVVRNQSIHQQPLIPIHLAQQQKPANIPSITPTAQASSSKSPLKIRLKLSANTASQDPKMVGRHHHVAVVQEESYSGRPRRGASQRAQAQMVSYQEDEDDEDFEDAEGEEDDGVGNFVPDIPIEPIRPTRSTRTAKAPESYGNEDDFEDKLMPSSPHEVVETRRTSGRGKRIVIDPDEEDDEDFKPSVPPRNAFPSRTTRTSIGSVQGTIPIEAEVPAAGPSYSNGNSKTPKRATRQSSKVRHSSADAEEFEPTDDGSISDDHASSDALGNYDHDEEEEDDDDLISRSSHESLRKRKTRSSARNIHTRSMPTRRSTRSSRKKADEESDDEYGGGGKRNLRTRTSKPNYHIPTIDDLSKEISMAEAMAAASRPNGRPGGVGGLGNGVRFGASGSKKGLPWSVKGRDLAQAMGDPDTSDSDDFATPLKSAGAGAGASMTGAGPVQRTNAVGPSDVPNYGRINPKSNMADADPLGVDMNVTFDNVGGLDDHINQLKEMVALPLLYPELFQQFGITPPRGVLFHGPPGTGKTLLARALAASCSTGNTKIAFFMRKGADVLSKWVGEAERQLRMLFEEARACQPSIIFFDEIDGIAPVRSSKQDQIHASLVSTLLALMDGMDGRGQVIVIGATNRPDAVDPALRRPGRFDREFYFPLPNRAARKKIIQINTRKWDPQLSDEFLEKLAQLTKGYGGADALCTETALNAIQRRYPQIYKTADRLQLETKSIHVSAKDFMMSIKKIVPSSARSTSSAAVQLPSHLVPLLSAPLDRIRKAIDHVLPPRKQATALEEAEWEEEEGDSFEKHMMMQSLDKLRTFKPRILVHGESGMGQTYLGPAILHHLEGFHVQSFDLGTLMGDSTKSVEASVVQLIIEAKRHQPSIIFVPSLSAWSATITDTARATIKTLLDGIAPTDPILLLGVSDAPVDDLPFDVKGLFGFGPENRIGLELPTQFERSAYFSDLLAAIHRPPTEFPDGIPRKKRVFEVLPLAAPLPPREPTAAELLREDEKDQAARDMIFQSFVHLVRDFLKRHRKVVASVKDDAIAYSNYLAEQAALTANPSAPASAPVITIDEVEPEAAAIMPTTEGDVAMLIDPSIPPVVTVNGSLPSTNGADTVVSPDPPFEVVPSAPAEVWQAHPIDIDTLQFKLLKHKYYTPSDFLADIAKIEENAAKLGDPDRMARVQEMSSSARYHVQGFDQKWIPEFERYKERVLAKKAEKQKKKAQAEAEKDKGKEKQGESAPVDLQVNGDAGTIPVIGEASTLKRARDGEHDGGELSHETQGREKRIRDGEMEIDETQLNEPQQIANSVSSTLLNGSQPLLPAAISTSMSLVETTTIPSVPPPSTSIPTYPPFNVPQDILSGLVHDLNSISNTLNIDQLEQLRASLFDIIWRCRTEWDRTAMLENMRSRVVEWGREVEKWKEAGRW